MPTARLEDVEIYYETHGDPDGVPLLLIIGIGNQLTTWPDEFCQGFTDREFFVIRFDHRDTGYSTRFTNASTTSARSWNALLPVSRRSLPTQSPTWLPTASGCWTTSDRSGARLRGVDGRNDRPDDGNRAS